MLFRFSSELETCAGGNEVDCKPPDQLEGDIDEYLNTLEQDDPVLIEAIQNYYLDRPNDNFSPNIPQERLTPNALAVSIICIVDTLSVPVVVLGEFPK